MEKKCDLIRKYNNTIFNDKNFKFLIKLENIYFQNIDIKSIILQRIESFYIILQKQMFIDIIRQEKKLIVIFLLHIE